MRDLVQMEVSVPRNVTQWEAGHDVEETDQLCSFVPGITNQPFVRAFAGQHNFLPITVDATGKLEKRGARSINDRSFRGGDQFRISRNCIVIAKILYNRWLGADVACRQAGRIKLVEF